MLSFGGSDFYHIISTLLVQGWCCFPFEFCRWGPWFLSGWRWSSWFATGPASQAAPLSMGLIYSPVWDPEKWEPSLLSEIEYLSLGLCFKIWNWCSLVAQQGTTPVTAVAWVAIAMLWVQSQAWERHTMPWACPHPQQKKNIYFAICLKLTNFVSRLYFSKIKKKKKKKRFGALFCPSELYVSIPQSNFSWMHFALNLKYAFDAFYLIRHRHRTTFII